MKAADLNKYHPHLILRLWKLINLDIITTFPVLHPCFPLMVVSHTNLLCKFPGHLQRKWLVSTAHT